ncbi:MAG: competence/damage-inducible protein A [Bacteroidetes bacterium]|nr:competence/damage-inducible protein A [Bacteroidota bacterium]
MHRAEIISIGDELLIGQVVNTNATWMAQQLNDAGISVIQVTTISDNREHILQSLKDSGNRADVVLITGGLGPTKDDITKKVLCEYFETKLVYNEEVFEQIKTLFEKRGFNVNRLNKEQAEVPGNCKPIRNAHGTAPGMWFEKDDTIYISMPGVPFEMQPMISDYIIPALRRQFNPGSIIHKTLLTQGIPESILAQRIEEWEDHLPENIKLAYLPQPGMVRLRLSGYGQNKEELEKQVADEIEKLNRFLPGEVFGYDDDRLELIIGNILRNRNQTLSTAESCTGGYIAHLITTIPGSSDYFKGSVVAYANEIKQKALGVKESTLNNHGAVSEEVVKEMAEGIKRQYQTDYAIAVSGIAGPTGGTPEKPVGTTWIAVATPETIVTKKFKLGEHRERNIRKAALSALNMLWKQLKS